MKSNNNVKKSREIILVAIDFLDGLCNRSKNKMEMKGGLNTDADKISPQNLCLSNEQGNKAIDPTRHSAVN